MKFDKIRAQTETQASLESFLINRDHSPLNKNKQSLSLKLFDS